MMSSMLRVGLAAVWGASTATGLNAADKPLVPALRGDAIVLENAACRYEIGVDGKNRALVNLADGKDYGVPGQPFMLAGQGQKTWPSTKVELTGDVLRVSFAPSGIQATARVAIRPRYFTLAIDKLSAPACDWLQLCNLRGRLPFLRIYPCCTALWCHSTLPARH